MKICIVSDSHDHRGHLAAAVADAKARGAQAVLHCGDTWSRPRRCTRHAQAGWLTKGTVGSPESQPGLVAALENGLFCQGIQGEIGGLLSDGRRAYGDAYF